MKENNCSHNWGVQSKKYDGQIKGFNAIACHNEKEIYRFDYKDPKCYQDKVLQLSINDKEIGGFYKECTSINDLPKVKGVYWINYRFYFDENVEYIHDKHYFHESINYKII